MVGAVGIGGAPPPKKDLHRLVKWPRYVRIQRQRRVLGQRLKVPPALTRFTKTLDKSTAATLFKLLLKYRPEARKEKKERLLKEAESREAGQKVRLFAQALATDHGCCIDAEPTFWLAVLLNGHIASPVVHVRCCSPWLWVNSRAVL